jgi:hypothetical protein
MIKGDIFWFYALLTTSALAISLPIYSLLDSIPVYLRARLALQQIALGDDYRKYRNYISDAKIDGLAGLLLGGRKALYKACRAGHTSQD